MSLNISPRFSIPFASLQVPDADQLNATLREKFLAWEREEGTRSSMPTTVDRHALYESDFSLFRSRDPDIGRLAQLCLSAVGQMIKEINSYSVKEMQQLRIYDHSWFHITRYGGYFGAHNHPMASWSGVYCVDPGSGGAAGTHGGTLRFLEARTTAGMYLDPGNAHMTNPYTFGDLTYSLDGGMMVLFPSFLQHEVTPFWGQGERITVAFNCWVRYADQAVDEPGIRLRDTAR